MSFILAKKRYFEDGFFVVKHVKRISSTNDALKALSTRQAREGFVLVADVQTKGKGRLGRTFFSPQGGLYFSILTEPKSSEVQNALTILSAVAVAKAVRETTGDEAYIKWVNDVYISGKKCCGILTETTENLKGFAIVGIGVNIGCVPQEVQDIACGVTEQGKDTKEKLLKAILNHFKSLYKDFDKQKIVEEYRSLCMLIGRKVTVLSNDGSEYKALAKDLDGDCHLVVIDEQGQEHTLASGEVKIII
ncbi:MAG: biotin--[Clostridia bacterium]|nr:biotin--[acetyl-CoA-carboxylase] ligase [Clostridia bacterium]